MKAVWMNTNRWAVKGAALLVTSVVVGLSGCAVVNERATSAAAPSAAALPSNEVAPTVAPCPEGVPSGARCHRGRDSAGAPYLIAMPAQWSGVLFVHAHGGPFLGAPTDARADEDAKRWSIIVREGHAYAASVFRQGGFAVTSGAEDTERVRKIFVDHIAKPKRTILHGQSWGAMVAARAGEMFPRSWDGILFTSGVVAGATTYDFRVDARAIYQSLCNNHPRPSEPQYALSIGLPQGASMNGSELTARVNECLALNKPAAERTPEQRQKAKTLADALAAPESSIHSHINWGTFTLADVARRHGGAPIGNAGVRYVGTSDDAALNSALDRAGLRFAPDREARARFLADVEHAGRFAVPVLTTHGIGDSTVFVEGGDTLRMRMMRAGNGDRLVQTFVDSREHSYLGDAIYPPLFDALLTWIERGNKPTPASIADQCRARVVAANRVAAECLFRPEFAPKPLASRIVPR